MSAPRRRALPAAGGCGHPFPEGTVPRGGSDPPSPVLPPPAGRSDPPWVLSPHTSCGVGPLVPRGCCPLCGAVGPSVPRAAPPPTVGRSDPPWVLPLLWGGRTPPPFSVGAAPREGSYPFFPGGCCPPWAPVPRGADAGGALAPLCAAAAVSCTSLVSPHTVCWGVWGCQCPRVAVADPPALPLSQRSTWSCCGTAGRSSGTCAASTSSVRRHRGAAGGSGHAPVPTVLWGLAGRKRRRRRKPRHAHSHEPGDAPASVRATLTGAAPFPNGGVTVKRVWIW